MFMGHFWVCHHNPPFFPIVQCPVSPPSLQLCSIICLKLTFTPSTQLSVTTSCINFHSVHGLLLINTLLLLQTGIMNLITIAWVNTDNEFSLLILICCPAAVAAPSMSMWLCVGCWHSNVNVLCPVYLFQYNANFIAALWHLWHVLLQSASSVCCTASSVSSW